jgi:GST-like protein
MITLYTWTTPNGRKIPIMLEELGIPYTIETVNIGEGEQFKPAFLAISPNNKIPAIVDADADGRTVAVFESGAILTYLAEKTGRLLPASGPERYKVLEWLHWQIGGLGPMFGQLGFFELRAKEKSELASKHFLDEAERLLA